MWAELQEQTRNNIGFEEKLSLAKPKIEDWALTKVLLKLVVVWFGVAVILPVAWASAINIPQSISRFLFSPPFNSLEAEKFDAEVDRLLLKHQLLNCQIDHDR